MRTRTLLIVGAFVLAAVPVFAGDDDEMRAAQNDLRSAHTHLKAAQHDYDGHRRQAADLVERALSQVEDGLKVANRDDKRETKKVNALENREKKIENRIDKLKQ